MFGIGEMKNDIQRLIRYDKQKDEYLSTLLNRVRELESKEVDYKKQLEQLNWKLDNPCPYRVGQKINGQIITEVYVSWYNHCSFNIFNKNTWMYKSVKIAKP